MQLTRQLYLSGRWHDAMHLDVEKPETGQNSPCSFAYEQAFLTDHPDSLDRPTSPSVSARIPLGRDLFRMAGLPAFLHDIVPAGAARRFLLARLALPEGENTHPRISLGRLDTTLREWGLR
jgi:serine/threonine-protein kinase HipA